MGSNKKSKNGPTRKDGYYKLAKEKGYRARSAFKLVHLNSIYSFLKNAKVCIDLCASPGSWMQVARESMPLGSVIVGVDLHPIKPIPNTLSIQGDITTQSLRNELRNTLKNYKADVVLHDGAPNVGSNWAQDAYDQNVLVLHAFKLACEFLKYGGNFVTKVFRSKDSTKLEFVFKSLFKKVECTKPQASRYESAEIFYVCRFYKLRPQDKVDPKFFDAKDVFKEIEPTEAKRINLNRPEKIRKKSEGYEDGAEMLYSEATVTEFIESTRHEELLQKTSKLVIDERWEQHPSLSHELLACCEDIKVLGRKELKMLLTWRKTLKAEHEALKTAENESQEKSAAAAKATEPAATAEEEDEEARIQKQIEGLEEKSRKEDKRQKKAVKKQKKQLQQKLKLMGLSGSGEVQRDDELFNIVDMEKVKDMDTLMAQYDKSDTEDDEEALPTKQRYRKSDYELDESGTFYRRVGDVSDSESEDDIPEAGEGLFKKKKKILKADGIEFVSKEDTCKLPKKSVRFADDADSSGDDDDESDIGALGKEDLEEDSGAEEDEEEVQGEKLTTDLMGDIEEERKERTAESWFAQNDLLNNLLSDDDEDLDLEMNEAIKSYKGKGGVVFGETSVEDTEEKSSASVAASTDKSKRPKKTPEEPKESLEKKNALQPLVPKAGDQPAGGVDGPDGVTSSKITAKRLADMDAVSLALATKLVKSKKARRDIYDEGWNRYMVGGEEDLPMWFVNDERENMAPVLDVDEKDVRFFKARDRAVNARNLKKVMEAKARKQRRFKKTMQKVVKKAEAMQGSTLGDVEKQQEVKNLYKKAMRMTKKKETTYVVMSKKNKGKKPRSVKGRYKMVDARLRKDVRGKVRAEARRKKFAAGKPKANRKR